MGGSSGILLLLLGAFLLVSFVTGRLDWLRRLDQDVAAIPGSPAIFGGTGAAPTTAGGSAA